MAQDGQEGVRDRDEELVRAAQDAREGDLRAFEQLVELYQKRITADCRYLTRDESNYEDLAQEVFVKAFFGIRGFDGHSSFRHWLQRIKVHHCLNHIKKHGGKSLLPIDDSAPELYEELRVPPAADREVESMEDRKRIDEVLNTLPATLRIPLIMRDMDELSYEEIASALGVGLSAIKMRIKRAREQFRRIYKGEERTTGAAR
jgi:RNA polymerase sigma-70 factor (ECF subfamily)